MKTALILPALAMLVAGCSTIDVDMDHDPTADFASYATFDWAPAGMMKVHSGYNELLDQRIRKAVVKALAAENIRPSKDAPQLLVAYHTGVRERTEYRDTGWSTRYGGRGYSVGFGHSTIEERNYLEGTLLVDLVDREKNQLVWRGRATGVVGDYDSQEARINEAVTKMFERYPPPAE